MKVLVNAYAILLKHLNNQAQNGIEPFRNATEFTFGTKIFYDTEKQEVDGTYPIVLDACIIDDPECLHHDVVGYYQSELYNAGVVMDEAGCPYIKVALKKCHTSVIIGKDKK